MTSLPRYATTEKNVGETPLVALERLRSELKLSNTVPMAYAGRLDPMASGKLLILIGDECKVQEKYHTLDKEYRIEILLGAKSDTADVLGIVGARQAREVTKETVAGVLEALVGKIALPYPHFSSRTVKGKPLHTWTLEGRLNEIEIPVKESVIYKLTLNSIRSISKDELLKTVREKIETIPEVNDPKKALGEDFRRDHVRASWSAFEKEAQDSYQILTITCIASSGTYMRSLAEVIGNKLGTEALAYSIHRTTIGKYIPIIGHLGFWTKKYR
jgi:tRNA pseudouridine(55) synthase